MFDIHRRIILFILVFILISALVACSKSTIKENEVGVVAESDGSYKMYKPGEEVSVTPFKKLHIISTSPVILSLVGDEGVAVPLDKEKNINIESQIIYDIDDVEKVVKKFGVEDVHSKIREQIKSTTSKIITDGFKDPGSIDNTQHRIQMMAETNFKLNETMNPDGVHVGSFKIRYE
jgi:regulator of protease activity HflC (stomatin/prohibitin superfamily)